MIQSTKMKFFQYSISKIVVLLPPVMYTPFTCNVVTIGSMFCLLFSLRFSFIAIKVSFNATLPLFFSNYFIHSPLKNFGPRPICSLKQYYKCSLGVPFLVNEILCIIRADLYNFSWEFLCSAC